VSHDRYFVSQTATKILEIRDGEFRLYRGDFKYYLDKIAEEKDLAKLSSIEAGKAAKADAKRDKQKEKESARKDKKKAS
jgi:ATP-binding cassette, subfamily F, member 3